MSLQHREEVRRLNDIFGAWLRSAERQGVDPAEITLSFPVPPPEAAFGRMLNDDGDGPGDEGNNAPFTVL